MTESTHIHNFELYMWSRKELFFKCECGEKVTRPPTPEEEVEMQAYIDRQNKEMDKMHALWHELSPKIYFDEEKPFQLPRGRELTDIVDLFREEHPEVVRTGCDDNHHMTSDIYLVPHETESYYWGTTVLVACQEGSTIEFFLYPSHLNALIQTLQEIQKRQKAKPRRTEDDFQTTYEVPGSEMENESTPGV